MDNEDSYMIVSAPQNFEAWPETRLKTEIEKGDTAQKTEALKTLIYMTAGGQKVSKDLLMCVIRFLIPATDKHLKKLLLVFWELTPRYADSKLLPEMILVCDAFRKDLIHPNEFVRGSILRFLCKLREPEILEPIMPSIRACLEHKTAYVRKNAVLAIFTIYKNFDYLIPDAPELLERFLDKEDDCACQRNAYMMLIHCDQKRAVDYLKMRMTSLSKCNEILQLAIVDLLYSYCAKSNSTQFLQQLFELVNSQCKAVSFAASNAIIALSDSRAAFEFAIKAYVNLLTKESDNNARIILINQLVKINDLKKFDYIFREISLDLLMVLNVGSSGAIVDLDVAHKLVKLVINILPVEHCATAISFIQKELIRIQALWGSVSESSKGNSKCDIIEYHRLLINFVKSLLERHSDIHNKVLPMLVLNIASSHSTVALDILEVIRNIIITFPNSKEFILHELSLIINTINDVNIFRISLWIMVECACTAKYINLIIDLLSSMIVKDINLAEACTKDTTQKSNVVISSDGSYVSAPTSNISQPRSNAAILNKFISDGSTHICSSIATLIIKLSVLVDKYYKTETNTYNILMVKLLEILVKIIYFYHEKFEYTQNIDIQRCYVVLNMFIEELWIDSNDENPELKERSMILKEQISRQLVEFINLSQDATKQCIKTKETSIKEIENPIVEPEPASDNNDSWNISFNSIVETTDKTVRQNIHNESLMAAMGKIGLTQNMGINNKIIALTGMSDPIYAETCVNISNFDIRFDVLVVNQTQDSLQNVSVDMRTQGDYRVIVRSPPVNLAPYKFTNMHVCLRLTSSESHVVFGSIYYDTSGPAREAFSIILDEIVLDLTETAPLQYISSSAFQKMWADFEWENKVSVAVENEDFDKFIDKVVKKSRMTPVERTESSQECNYLVVNLYSKNLFGDEAVANISIEKSQQTNQIVGNIRIRAKTQTIAITIGQKFTEIIKTDQP